VHRIVDGRENRPTSSSPSSGRVPSRWKTLGSARVCHSSNRGGMIVFQKMTRCRGRIVRIFAVPAVTDRGYHAHIGGNRIDQASGGKPRAFVLGRWRRRGQASRVALRPTRRGRLPGSGAQAAVGGRIQVANMARHLETVALRASIWMISLAVVE